MKTTFYKIVIAATAVVVLLVLATNQSFSQNFQRQFGSAFDNAFIKTFRSGTNYYVLGRDQPSAGALSRASVSLLNASGQLQWTLSLDIASAWNDAVVTPNGNLFLVGTTLPVDASNKSVMGVVTAAGAFSWVRDFDAPGREAFVKIVRNPVPQSASFPYYVLGFQPDPAGGNVDDVVLLNVSETGTINWKKIYSNTADDEFFKDLEALPSGDMLLCGNQGANGLIMRVSNTGIPTSGATPDVTPFSFADVAQAGGGNFYAVGISNGVNYLMKFDTDLINLWEATITGVSSVNQVWQEPDSGKIYVTGNGVFNGKSRAVVLRFSDSGAGPSLDWVKYLDNAETSYSGGQTAFLSPDKIAFADGRIPLAGGFGLLCAFMSVSDLNMTSCMTASGTASVSNTSVLFNGPGLPDVQFYDTPPFTNLASSALNWQQGNTCALPCVAAFIIQNVGGCFYFQTNNSSSGPPPLTYQWNFGDPASGANNTSVAQNPDHVFSGCGTYTVCLTVTGAGCTASVCHTVTVTDITPPSILCPAPVNYQCEEDVPLLGSVVVTATDNCTPPQSITITAMESVNGVLPCNASIVRTWVAQDLCGNTSSCSQTIFVNDNQAPVLLNCPPSVVNVQCASQVPPPAVVVATDNCAPAPGITFSAVVNGILPCNASIVRTWEAEDACGNTSACTQTIFVNDNQAPVLLNCPPSVVNVQCASQVPPSAVVTATDNCAAAVTITEVVNGVLPCNASIVRTWEAEDACGNTTACTQTIFVNDNQAPVLLNCPPSVVNVQCASQVPPPAVVVATDNCTPPPGITFSEVVNGILPCNASIVRTWEAEDACGNTSACTQTIFVNDTQAPLLFSCPPNFTVNTNPGVCYYTGMLPKPTANDNCQPAPTIFCFLVTPNQSIPITPQTQFPKGDNTITCYAEDACGNQSQSCSFIVTVRDVEPPTITCPNDLSISGSGCPVAVYNLQPTNISDNCGVAGVSAVVAGATTWFGQNDASGVLFNQGVSTVVYTVTDICGNSTSCSVSVTVACGPNSPPNLCGQAALTCFSGFNNPYNPQSGLNPNGVVLALVDPRALTNVPANGMDASNPVNGLPSVGMVKDPQWVYSRMGQVFGLAIDANDFVYATASTIYGKFFDPFNNNVTFGTAGAGGIYKINPTTGAVTDFVKTTTTNNNPVNTNFIYNTGSGLGNICYDKTYNQFFVTNFTDGKIYRIDINGIVQSIYDHPGAQTFPPTDPTYIPLGDRPYGIQVHPQNGRLYYNVWREDLGRISNSASNEVWSIALTNTGDFMGAASLVLQLPPIPSILNNYSNAPSDLAFSQNGKMLIGERTTSRDWPLSLGSPAHDARVLEYCCDPAWGAPTTFYVGNLSTNTNCSGGIDYGYAGFDFVQDKPTGCDGLIWSTGDALKYTSFYNAYPGDNEVVYGLAGLPASGNSNIANSPTWVKTTSYYIDMGLPGKTEFGDVEVFKCECLNNSGFPCDSLWVTKTQPDTGKCCFNMTLDVHAGPVAYVEAESLTPGVVFNNVTLGSSFSWTGNPMPNGTLLSFKHNPFQGIPQGTYTNALKFCLGNILTPIQVPQCVVFRWYVKGPDDKPYLACTDTCYFECPLPVVGDTCLVVKSDSIYCDPANPKEYCLFLTVENTSTDLTFIANQLIMSGLTPGFSFKPCPPPSISFTAPSIALNLIPSIAPGSTSSLLCVKIVALAPVLTPTVVCMDLGLSGSNDCCNSTIPFCVTLEPCCDPCADNGVVVHTEVSDSCCHALDIINNCNYNFFTKLELELLTPGVSFGSHFIGGPTPGDWSNPVSQYNLIQWQHVSGYIPNGTIAGLVNFCIDGIDNASEIPQTVVLNWIIPGSNGQDSIACSDTLVFECPQQDFPCIEVLNDTIRCLKDANGNTYYEYTLTFQNTSFPPHTANELVFTQIGTPLVWVFPNPVPLVPPLLSSGTTTITTNIFGSGLNPGDKLTFEVRLHDSNDPDDWCCFEGDTLCIFIPPCDTCCTDSIAFFNAATNFEYFGTLGDCTIFVGGVGLSDCMQVTWFWGDGSSSGPVGNNTAVSHTYTNGTGDYEVCYLIEELDLDSMVCWEYFDCDTVYVICDSCCMDYDLFCQTVMNATVVTVDSSICKATLNIGNLPDCDVIEFINWGEGPNIFGPFMAGDMPMHMYTGSGSYIISYLAVERDPLTGLICYEKVLYDTITVVCDTCVCNMPDLQLTQNGVSYQLFCAQGPPTPVIPCPAGNVVISGFFGCVFPNGQPCSETPVNWSLSGPNGLTAAGSTTNSVQITFPAAQVSANGTYLLTLSTLCPGAMEPCVCTVRWIRNNPNVWVKTRVFLQGPYVSATQLMNDHLRTNGLIPLEEPYSNLMSFTHVGGGGGEQTTPAVFAVSGSDAIVDWVFLELRSAEQPAVVVATRSALVQRDGDVVDTDGTSPVVFGVPADQSYFLVVRHRNHLGVQLGAASLYPICQALEKDFTNLPPEEFYEYNGLNPAQRIISGRYALWAGNGRIDNQLKYNGSNNDRTAILSVVGLATPNATVPGYLLADYNLDGVVKYNGAANDRNVLLGNVGIATPSKIIEDQVAR